MKIALCHYSLHRRCVEESWSLERFAGEVVSLGVKGIDFHARFLGDPATAAGRITSAVSGHALTLSGLSLSNDFNQEDAKEFSRQVSTALTWVCVAAKAGADVSRIFGGHIAPETRLDAAAFKRGAQRILDGLGLITREAEKLGVVLALENHGDLFPGTGEEQAEAIEKINSPNLRATIDVGNYMMCGQEGSHGTATVAKYAAYVHFKDYVKLPDPHGGPFGCGIDSCVVGEGEVDHRACLETLRDAGYDGFVALEYEGLEDEKTGVPKSVEYIKKVMADF